VPDQKLPTHRQAQAALLALRNEDKALFQAGYFKTGKGQYGEGDAFLGITVPIVRQQTRRFRDLPLADCEMLLQSPFNEVRLLALLILVHQFRQGDAKAQRAIYQSYMAHRDRVNNWNLVDSSAPFIAGPYLLSRSRRILMTLAKSPKLWDRRIAVLSTFAFIRTSDFEETLKLTTLLLGDHEDLMHKACGWMLREIGNRDAGVLETFLRMHHCAMPRTMLRYAIEKFNPAQRRTYLTGSL
jgi:3-methyladenine DNA glycosylase AlkD